MELSEYLKKNGISRSKFNALTGVSKTSLHYYIKEGRVPTRRVADIIIRVTNGEVSYKDLGLDSSGACCRGVREQGSPSVENREAVN